MKNITLFLLIVLLASACQTTQIFVPAIEVVTFPGRLSIRAGEVAIPEKLPALTVSEAKVGDIIKVNADFYARTDGNGRSKGFYYHLRPTYPGQVEELTPNDAIFQACSGWQSCNLVVYYRVLKAPISDYPIQFAMDFAKRDVSGSGQIGRMTLTAEVFPKGAVTIAPPPAE